MCDPVSIAVATAAVGAASTYAQYQGTNAAYQSNKAAANLDFANRSDILGQKRIQLDQEKSETAVDTAIATVKAQGEVAASAASQGYSSSSIVGALNADMFGIGRQAEAADTNDQNQRLQLANEARGADIARASKIASAPRMNALDLAVGFAGDALKGANAYSTAGGKYS